MAPWREARGYELGGSTCQLAGTTLNLSDVLGSDGLARGERRVYGHRHNLRDSLSLRLCLWYGSLGLWE
jgi:hypothetical protein